MNTARHAYEAILQIICHTLWQLASGPRQTEKISEVVPNNLGANFIHINYFSEPMMVRVYNSKII